MSTISTPGNFITQPLHAELIVDGVVFQRGSAATIAELFDKMSGEDVLSDEDPCAKFMQWLDTTSVVSLVNLAVGQSVQMRGLCGNIIRDSLIGQAIASAEVQN